MAATVEEMRALHRYLVWSLNMRDHFRERVKAQRRLPKDPQGLRYWMIKPFMYASLWFSLLFVVVEGYRDLELSDSIIDPMLASPNVELLRRFRNGALHYQRDYFDPRFVDFLTDQATDWAQALHNEFNRFFLEWFRSKGMEIEVLAEQRV